MADGFMHSLTDDAAALTIARLSAHPETAFAVPLFRALRMGLIVLGFAPRGAGGLDTRRLDAARVPAVLVIQDDDHASTGPAGFPVARKALRWARSMMIHGTGGKAEHYEAAVALALRHGNLVLVETAAAHVPAWLELARRAAQPRVLPGVILMPSDGGPHPIVPKRARH